VQIVFPVSVSYQPFVPRKMTFNTRPPLPFFGGFRRGSYTAPAAGGQRFCPVEVVLRATFF
jgi:hypothetical protein